jgi:hypothetical protein
MDGSAARSSGLWRGELALKPEDGETFLREVDEELRRDQMNRFIKRYGWAIAAVFVLAMGGLGGWIWWQGHQQEAVAKEGDTLAAALDSLEAGNRNAAAPKIAELENSSVPGYRAAALFARANSQTAAGNAPAAIATLSAIAGNQDFDEVYRQAALVRQTQLEFDTLPPQQVVQRLRPLARPGSAWLGSAGEMLGIAYLKMHRPDLAGPVFGAIGRDQNVPDSIRTRAIQMAGSLGVSVTDEPAAPAAGTPAPPAQPAQPAAPAGPAQPAPAATRDNAQ